MSLQVYLVKLKRDPTRVESLRAHYGPLIHCVCVCVCVCVYACACARFAAQSCLTLCNHGLEPARLLCPWDFPGKTPRADCHFLLPRVFPRPRISCVSYIGSTTATTLYHYITWEAQSNTTYVLIRREETQ